ncbi:MAG: hypothetical protein AAF747_02720 [Planctomycetota bacterium]
MASLLVRMASVLWVPRFAGAVGAIANAWFVVLWSRGTAGESVRALWLELTASAVAAAGLFTFGALLNDDLDRGVDTARRPLRSSPARVQPSASALWSTLALLAAIGAASVFGPWSVRLTALVAAGVVVFNAIGRFVPGLGLTLFAGLHAAAMLVPKPGFDFLWPVLLVFTHALVVATAVHVIGRRPPPLTARAGVAAVLGWISISGFMLWLMTRQPAPLPIDAVGPMPQTEPLRSLWALDVSPWIAVMPGVIWLLFFVVAARKVSAVGPGERAAEKVDRYGAMWMPLLGLGWLLPVVGLELSLILAALALGATVGVAFLRDAYELADRPVAYRR